MNRNQFRVILAYKNFGAHKGISHIGLGVSALNTCKTLISQGIMCEVWPLKDGTELRQRLNLSQSTMLNNVPITHVVISAPWIPTAALQQLCMLFPRIQFAMNSHSNVGFLQADTNGMKLIREALELELGVPNFHFAGNSDKFCRWIMSAYGRPCTLLPNLYALNESASHKRPRFSGGVLKIGGFGAVRPQKNLATSAAAAVSIARKLKVDTEFWISAGRSEGGGDTIVRTIREMLRDIPGVTLRESGWQTWPGFRTLIGSMHLLLQPSYTESFNMVTADGVAEGVPSVTSDAIDWVPDDWRAHFDVVDDIAEKGIRLIKSRSAPYHGKRALAGYVDHGIRAWLSYLVNTAPL